MHDFETFVRNPIPNGRFADYNSLVRDSEHFGKYFVLDPKKLEHCYGYSDLLQAYRNAELYRMAILDENLPAEMGSASAMLLDHSPFFCRYFWIVDLGRIRYKLACPELREVMLHDFKPNLRGAAAEALGKTGDKRYTKDLIHAMHEDKSPHVAARALTSLGYMGDESAVHVVRETLEQGRRDIYLADLTKDRDRWHKGQDTIINSSRVMTKLGKDARKTLREFLKDPDFWVRWSTGKGIEYSQID